MIIREGQENLINTSVPQVVVIETNPKAQARGVATNVVGLVGQFNRGDVGETYSISDMTDFSRVLGDYVDGMDGYQWCENFFLAGGGVIKATLPNITGRVKASAVISGNTGTAFTLTMKQSGTFGNNWSAIVSYNPTVTGYFDLTVQRGLEVSQYKRVTTNSADTANYIKTKIDQDVNASFTIAMTLTNGTLPLTGTTNFSGGLDGSVTGSSVLDAAYIGTDDINGRTGIQVFKETDNDDCVIVCSARSATTINNALIAHVESVGIQPRRTILSFPIGTSVDAIESYMTTISTDKAKFIASNVKIYNPLANREDLVPANSFAAGIDTLQTYDLSASRTVLPANVIGVERKYTSNEIVRLTMARTNPIKLERNVGYLFVSDWTASSNSKLAQNFVRKAKDYFGRSFDVSLQQFISKPIDQTLWSDIYSALTTFLQLEANAGRIGVSTGGTPFKVKVDASNNPPAIIQLNTVNIEVVISVKGKADIIKLFMNLDIENGNLNVN